VLDGEIVCLDRHGKPQFRDLLFRRGEPRFYAFDLLSVDGEDRGGYVGNIARVTCVTLESFGPARYCQPRYSSPGEGCYVTASDVTVRGVFHFQL
jgi:hypothetical protein